MNQTSSKEIIDFPEEDYIPSQNEMSNQQIIKEIDIRYHKNNTLNKLDLFYKKGLINAPIVVIVHGGGWKTGDKQSFQMHAMSFANKEFLVIVPNYRLSPKFKYPTHIEDVACSIVWIQKNAYKLGGDKTKVIIVGNSAGSHIGAMLSYDDKTDWLKKCYIQNEKLNIKGFIGMSGVYDFDLLPKGRYGDLDQFLNKSMYPNNWELAEPINHISLNDPPALLIHGNNDFFVNYNNSINFANILMKNGIDVELQLIEGYEHDGPKINFIKNIEIQNKVDKFLQKITN